MKTKKSHLSDTKAARLRNDGNFVHVDRHGHFTLKQLRLSLVIESHTKPYTGPRLSCTSHAFVPVVVVVEY